MPAPGRWVAPGDQRAPGDFAASNLTKPNGEIRGQVSGMPEIGIGYLTPMPLDVDASQSGLLNRHLLRPLGAAVTMMPESQ
jgi:hypothetical protein